MGELTTQDSLAAPATESLEALVARAKRNKRGYSCRNDRFLALVAELEQLRAQVCGVPTSVRPPPVNVEVLAAMRWDYDIVRRLPRGGYWGRDKQGLTDGEVLVWWPMPAVPEEVGE